jgi:ATP phosphoribosyltransferase
VIQEKIDLPKQEILSEEEIQELRAMVEELVDLTYGSERLIVSASGESKPTNTGDKPTTVKPAATGGVISGEVPE